MAPPAHVDDYYDILNISNTAAAGEVIASYRRLVKIRHPDKKRGSTDAFQQLGKAYEILKDPVERRAYDSVWPGIRDRLGTQHQSDLRQAEAAEAETRREAEARAKKQEEARKRRGAEARAKTKEEDEARRSRGAETRAKDLENAGRQKSFNLGEYDKDISDLHQHTTTLEKDLNQLEDQDNEDPRIEKEQNSYRTYLSSYFYPKAKETEEQKQARENERIQRRTSRRFKEILLTTTKGKLQRQRDALQRVIDQIAAEEEPVEYSKKKEESGGKWRRKTRTERRRMRRRRRKKR
ncbi:hypothetical protein HO133_009003 [Letharia lupina]|uniref:J domain-containing protein n=1 Tax=Letharia lupina TaxID=560253 RepID=A0A8H6CMJ3_9LECA|nr:uncharacterized protein HO133_009003 [Letharia lupina]KAF6226137.1 hypothetical protein HO133_009003 [Letharia lupina]